ncbi:C4-dicarboxylate ABC transporter [Pseudoroseomonas rhizosphaerae]|uniref:C4-dicarboxylate ABC transporter n=1 Tax=Teichococcus rhizosphaerae TaxID=1335062 RepID=A0A2C7A6T9_9PROT|nr:TRAP transporter substrate-binding protein [Pseudoroseomonas rhizosphaerae]PHK93045.1 C4-dicarboxylate ABC transporter [Pseudoroseomonas rhizosphaerae]
MSFPLSRRNALLALPALAAPTLIGFKASAQAINLRSADIHPDGYPTVEGVKTMARLARERSNGRINIQVFHSRQLGEEKDTLEQTRFGVIDINRTNFAPLNNLVPETVIPGLPFLFRDEAHMHTVMDGAIGQEILAGAERHGLIGLCCYDSGARSMYNRLRPIHGLADMKGMKVRVQQSDLWLAMIRALGANPTPMPAGEIYSALQTGVIEGAENNYPTYQAQRHFEVAKFYSTTEHSMSPEIVVMSKRSYDRLPRDMQTILRESARDSVPEMRRLWVARTETARREVVAAGTQINSVEKAPFEQAMAPVYDQFVRDARLKGLVQRIRETA